MKNLILSMCMVALSTMGFGQTTSKKMLYESRPYTSHVFYIQEINDDGNIYKMWTFRFDNLEYQYITDYGYIRFFNKEDIIEFTNRLEEFSLNMSTDDITFKGDGYSLSNPYMNMKKAFYIYDEEGHYNGCHKKTTIKMIEDIRNNLHLMD